MSMARIFRGLLSILLAAALVLPFGRVLVNANEVTEGTAAPVETQPPETVPEETTPETLPVVTPVTVALAAAMAEGTQGIALQGTVIYAENGQPVLQDSTGSICLTGNFSAAPGQVLAIVGSRTADGIAVESFENKGTADLPAQDTIVPAETQAEPIAVITATPLDGVLLPGENIGLHCETEGVSLFYSLSYDGVYYSDYALYSGGIPVTTGTGGVYVRAYARQEDGTAGSQTEFYFETADAARYAQTRETAPESGEWNLYFGQLHAHTDISDGTGTVEEAFQHAAKVEGLDFFAVTDHSQSFDNADSGAMDKDGTGISEEWAAGKAAAAAVTDENFVGIFGYEMTWRDRQQLGHINTFHTKGWQSRNQEGFPTLESYYEVLTTVPESISQFNHPGAANGNFENFTHYHPRYDAVIQLLEVGSEDDYTAYEYYTDALDAHWHVAPTNNQANHKGEWGDESSVRTVALARTLTEESLYDAMRNYRVYATEDSDLEILYYLNGNIMGSILNTPAEEITVSLRDATDAAIGLVEVIVDGGVTIAKQQVNSAEETLTIPVSGDYSYYYLCITQPDGDIAVTAPVWVDLTVDMGIQSFTADTLTPVQGQEVQLALEFFNNEREDLILEALEFYVNGQLHRRVDNPGTVAALDTFSYSLPFQYNGLGGVEIRAVVSGVPQSYETTLSLHYQSQEESVSLSTISYARSGTERDVYRIKGYVTAGTSNPYNTFPGTIYLQDSTGGIGVVSFTDSGIPVGAPMEVTGYLTRRDGNPVLELVNYAVLDEDYYRYVPETMGNSAAMDYAAYGGQLLQVEGQVVSLTRTADGLGVARFTLKDSQGNLATVCIDDAILSGTYGFNQLTSQVKAGSNVQAIGILCLDSTGTPVLRVRNCDEVVYVAALKAAADPTNPKTGSQEDMPRILRLGIALYLLLTVMSVTFMGLAALFQLWKKRR